MYSGEKFTPGTLDYLSGYPLVLVLARYKPRQVYIGHITDIKFSVDPLSKQSCERNLDTYIFLTIIVPRRQRAMSHSHCYSNKGR